VPPEPEELRRKLERERTLVLDVKVIPHAPVSEVVGWMADGALKIKVLAAPEKGKANEEVCAVLAAWLGVPKRSVAVIHGHTSRQKRLKISL
jgi:uncharacterized protein (TIGR00251 family)